MTFRGCGFFFATLPWASELDKLRCFRIGVMTQAWGPDAVVAEADKLFAADDRPRTERLGES